MLHFKRGAREQPSPYHSLTRSMLRLDYLIFNRPFRPYETGIGESGPKQSGPKLILIEPQQPQTEQ